MRVTFSSKELEEALEYYQQISRILTKIFYEEFIELNIILEQNPFFELKYNSVRTYKLKTFPYLVHFILNEELRQVTIIALVLGKMENTNFESRLKD